ncbi:MAG: hypothetical protein RIF33_03390 [Cyclobacteriaceae bacterium]
MTTITIKDNQQIDKTSFDSLEELAEYLFESFDFGQLKPLEENELSLHQKKRMVDAIKTPKSEMFNI